MPKFDEAVIEQPKNPLLVRMARLHAEYNTAVKAQDYRQAEFLLQTYQEARLAAGLLPLWDVK